MAASVMRAAEMSHVRAFDSTLRRGEKGVRSRGAMKEDAREGELE